MSLPAEGRWSLRLLSDDDFQGALEFLERDPLINVYLISRLLEERMLPRRRSRWCATTG